MRLPCRHMFYLRKHKLQIGLFDEHFCDVTWSSSFYFSKETGNCSLRVTNERVSPLMSDLLAALEDDAMVKVVTAPDGKLFLLRQSLRNCLFAVTRPLKN